MSDFVPTCKRVRLLSHRFTVVVAMHLTLISSHLFLDDKAMRKLNKTIADEGMVVIDYGLWRYHLRKTKKDKGCVTVLKEGAKSFFFFLKILGCVEI
jgi:hypothetical protein